jgi:hypothetical protein
LPTVSASNTGPYCLGANISLTATFTAAGTSTSAASWSWTGPDGFTSTMEDPTAFASTAAKAGVYTVEVTDNNGCKKTATTTVVVNPLPTATAVGGVLSCSGAALQLSGSGSTGAATLSFAWTTSNGNIVSGGNTAFPMVNQPGTYTLTVTDGNGCTDTDNAVVTPAVNCAHIFPTATTCCNYLGGTPENFILEKVCITVEGNKIKNAIPGVFFYYGDYTAATGGLTTIIVDQTSAGGLPKFDPQNLSNVRLFVDDCQNVTPSKVTIGTGPNKGDVTIEFNAVAGHTYVISVKYDVKSILGAFNQTGPLSATFGMIINGGPLVGIGKVDAISGTCSDTSGTPSGSCNTQTAAIAPIETTVTAKTTSNAGFDAYPVPFKDQLTIKYKFDYKSDVKIEVFNAQGMSVLTKTDTNSYLDKEVTLDLKASKRQEQVYIVKMTTDQGIFTKKVMSKK